MQAPINQEALQEKWAPLLDAEVNQKLPTLIVEW